MPGSASPVLCCPRGNEEGTEKKSRRYIHERASYLPTKKGGGGIKCTGRAILRSLLRLYAQWMIRYLHPRKAPWKEIADLWIREGTQGRGVIVSKTDLTDTLNAIPNTAPYLQRCLKSFIELEIRQNINTADHRIQSEPLWHNWRFEIQLPKARAEIWREDLGVNHFYDLLDAQSEPFEPSDWREFFNQLTPNEDQERMLDELQRIWDAVDRGGDQIGEDLWKNSQPPRPDTLINQNVALFLLVLLVRPSVSVHRAIAAMPTKRGSKASQWAGGENKKQKTEGGPAPECRNT